MWILWWVWIPDGFRIDWSFIAYALYGVEAIFFDIESMNIVSFELYSFT